MQPSLYGAELGALPRDGSTRFRAFASEAETCFVRLFDEPGSALSTHPMARIAPDVFECVLPGVVHGALYQFVLDDRELADPYARFLPYGVHGPAMVYETRFSFCHDLVRHPLDRQVIYELHVGTFTPQGTYEAVAQRLADLVALGVTTIELMPVAAFAGVRGWGYDGVAMFAPFAPYGTPDDLRSLVDQAHGHGLSVLLDVVYNHFGPAGNYLAAYSPQYFSREVHNAWGDAPNYSHPAMRAYAIDNARMWLRDFRFDGLRLDATYAIVDPSPVHVLRQMSDEVRGELGERVLIAEDDRNDPAVIRDCGLDAQWADDFHHQVHVTLTEERDGYYEAFSPSVTDLATVIERGWLYDGSIRSPTGRRRGKPAMDLAAHAFVYCIQNHDQVGNRALGERLHHTISTDAYCMASTILLFLPMTPLLFMGQEWAASSPFCYFTDHEPDLGAAVSRGRREEFRGFVAFSNEAERSRIPDPQAEQTFTRSILNWQERSEPPHRRVLDLYQRLLELRRSDPVLTTSSRSGLTAEARGSLLIVTRSAPSGRRTLHANLGREAVTLQAANEALLFHSAGHDAPRLGSQQALILGGSDPGAGS